MDTIDISGINIQDLLDMNMYQECLTEFSFHGKVTVTGISPFRNCLFQILGYFMFVCQFFFGKCMQKYFRSQPLSMFPYEVCPKISLFMIILERYNVNISIDI